MTLNFPLHIFNPNCFLATVSFGNTENIKYAIYIYYSKEKNSGQLKNLHK